MGDARRTFWGGRREGQKPHCERSLPAPPQVQLEWGEGRTGTLPRVRRENLGETQKAPSRSWKTLSKLYLRPTQGICRAEPTCESFAGCRCAAGPQPGSVSANVHECYWDMVPACI